MNALAVHRYLQSLWDRPDSALKAVMGVDQLPQQHRNLAWNDVFTVIQKYCRRMK